MSITAYTWNPFNDNVIEELDEAGNVTSVYSNTPTSFGSITSQKTSAATAFFHFDAVGSTRLMTDSTQSVTDTATYDSYGSMVASTGSTVTPYRWLGAYGYQSSAVPNDTYYIRARTYASNVARFSSADPMGLLPYNRWWYCRNSPLLFVDPSGLTWKPLVENSPELGNLWTTDSGDPLVDLVSMVSNLNPGKNKACIRPMSVGDIATINYRYGNIPRGVEPLASDWARFNGTKCAVYSVRNLTTTDANPLAVAVGADANGYITNASAFYSAQRFTKAADAAGAIQNQANNGLTPLSLLTIVGHGGKNVDYVGGMQRPGDVYIDGMNELFGWPTLKQVAGMDIWQFPSFADALDAKMPPGCWFTRDAEVRLVGCNTKGMAMTFAEKVLRKGATAFGTNTFTYAPSANQMGWGIERGGQIVFDNKTPLVNTIDEYHKSSHWESAPGKN